MNRVSDRLENKLELVKPSMQEAAHGLWRVNDAREIYPRYLEQMHMVVRSGVSLMETAVDVAKKMPSNCSMKNPLINYLEKHIDEERGHDDWLLEDYAATDHDPDHLISKIPSCHVANMAGAQYYWIIHHHPVMVMGHIAALEINHPPQGFSNHLANLTGYPMDAFRAIARHEKLDLVHKKEILALIDELGLTAKEEVSIGVSGLHTLQTGVEVLKAIRRRFQHDKPATSVTQLAKYQHSPPA